MGTFFCKLWNLGFLFLKNSKFWFLFLRCLTRSLSAWSECVNHGKGLQQCPPIALAGKFVQEDIRAEKERLHEDIQVCLMLCHRIVLSLWFWRNCFTPVVFSYFQSFKRKKARKSTCLMLLCRPLQFTWAFTCSTCCPVLRQELPFCFVSVCTQHSTAVILLK